MKQHLRAVVCVFATGASLGAAASPAAGCAALSGTFSVVGVERDLQTGTTRQITMNDRLAVKGVAGHSFAFRANADGSGYTISVLDPAGAELHHAVATNPAFKCEAGRLTRSAHIEATGDGNPTKNDSVLKVYIDGNELVFEVWRRTESTRWIAPPPVRIVHTETRYSALPAQ